MGSEDVTQRSPAIELLLRQADGRGYELRTFTAVESGLGFRPRPIPREWYQVNEIPDEEGRITAYLLRNTINGRIAQLSPHGYFVFSQMDGRATVLDLVTACFTTFGAIQPAEVWETIKRLREAGLIESRRYELPLLARRLSESPNSALRAVGRLQVVLSTLGLSLRDVDAWLSTLYARGAKWLFRSTIQCFYVALIGFGVCAFFSMPAGVELQVSSVWKGLSWALAAAVALLVVIPLHELAHALTCKHYGRAVRSLGFRFLAYVLPVPYADVTEIWMDKRSARTAVYFFGPISTLVMGSMASLLAWVVPEGVSQLVLLRTAWLSFALALIALHPFLPAQTDGYHILANHYGCPTLQQDALWFLRRRLRPGSRRGKGLSPRERTLVLYLVMTGLNMAVLAAAGILLAWVAFRPAAR